MEAIDEPCPSVLVTGSHGLIGTALRVALWKEGYKVRLLDLRATGSAHGDIRDFNTVRRAMSGCMGVVHLAAVSRVITGIADPDTCWQTNVCGTSHVLSAAAEVGAWVVYASSREVYGQPTTLPVQEDAILCPLNVYAHSKVAAEDLVRDAPLNGAIVRFSSVYGSANDHRDRVVPAFVSGALLGDPLRVEGSSHTFDFTHLDDAVQGVLAIVDRLAAGASLPPIHLVTGLPTTLGDLARLAIRIAGTASAIVEAPPRLYGVRAFYGDPRRAQDLLNWLPTVSLTRGLERMARDLCSVSSACVGASSADSCSD